MPRHLRAVLLLGVLSIWGCGADPVRDGTYDERGQDHLVRARQVSTQEPIPRLRAFVSVVEAYPRSPAARTALQQMTEFAVMSRDKTVMSKSVAYLKAWQTEGMEIAAEARWWHAHLSIYGYGNLKAARSILRGLVTAYPEHDRIDDALWLLGDIYRRQGAWIEARHICRTLAQFRREHGWAIGSERGRFADDAALLLADIDAFILKKPMAAVRGYEHFIAYFSDSVLLVHARLALAEVLLRLGRQRSLNSTISNLKRDDLSQRQLKRLDQLVNGLSAFERPPNRVFSTLGRPVGSH